MKEQQKKQKRKKINSKPLRTVTSNLKTEEDLKQFAQQMSGVLSALAN